MPAGRDGGGRAGGYLPLVGFLTLAALVLLAGWLPDARPEVTRDVVAVLGVVALAAGVWWRRPESRTGWWLTTVGAAAVVLAVMTIQAETTRLAEPGDWRSGFLGAGALLLLAAGLAVLGSLKGRAELTDALDAAMIALVAFLVLFALPLHPLRSGEGEVVTLALTVPVGALALLTMALRVLLVPGVTTVSLGLLLAAVAALVGMVGSTVIPALTRGGSFDPAPPAAPLWVAYGLLLGAAGLHPSLGRPARPRPRGPAYSLSLRRAVLLAVLSMAVPATWVVELWRTPGIRYDPVGLAVMTGAAGALLLLLVTRLTLTARVAERRGDELVRRTDELSEAVREQESLQRQLRHQATHDPLTGLHNRQALLERMEWVLTRQPGPRQLSLALLDLDNFKDVNLAYGQPAADEVLVTVARRLVVAAPVSGTLARLGADHFAALLEDTPAEQATDWAERARQALRRPYQVGRPDDGRATPDRETTADVEGQAARGEVTLSASIGLFTTGPAGPVVSPAEALRNADLAMHVAKADGKDRVVPYRPELRTSEAGLRRLSTGLRRALANDELVLRYQPTVELATGRVVAVEALLRWQPPDEPPIPPTEFIPVAEESGLIGQVGAWAMRRACRDARQWYERRGIAVAVNVSGRQLDDPSFASLVGDTLREAGLPGQALIIEITESSLVTTSAGSGPRGQLEQLRGDDVRVAIDDFGTGYSSLSYLAQLPADIVKIDKSFVQNPPSDTAAGPWDFTRAILRMVQTLRLEAVAEGVETTEQAETLRALGCRLGQGFLYARPMRRTDVDRFIARAAPQPAGATAGRPG